jgi:Ca2+-binding RTX toxin-like protein/plastocyanin
VAAVTVVSVALAAPAGAIPACTTTWTGAGGDGLWATADNWDNGVPDASSVACIPDVGAPGVDVEITLPGSLAVVGIENRERLVMPSSGGVAVTDEIVNHGVWRFANGGAVSGDGGDPESFTNTGTVLKQGGNTATFDANVVFDNTGTIAVDDGTLRLDRPGVLPGTVFQVAEGASLLVQSWDGGTQWSGVYDLAGGGTMSVAGEIDAIESVSWAFGAGEAAMSTVTVDTTAAPFAVTGTYNLDGAAAVRGDGLSVAEGGTFAVPSSAGVTLLDGADVVNQGVWRFANGGAVSGDGGDPESFSNTGTVLKQGGNTATFDANVVFNNTGTVHAAAGALNINPAGAEFVNHGTVRADAGATVGIGGNLTTDGKVVTVIASGAYGFVSAFGTADLAGEYEVVTADGFTPTPGEVYDVVRYGSRTGTFATHTGVTPLYTHAYDPGSVNALRLTVGGDAGEAPVADAGGPYFVEEGSPAVQLDGTGSSDPDGTIVSYSWVPATGLDDPTSATPTLTPPADDAVYAIELTVTDDDGVSDSATTDVLVFNTSPVITDVTLPATGEVDVPVGLAVSFSDPGTADTHNIQVTWGDATTSNESGVTSPVQLEHTYTEAGEYLVSVCVNDDDVGQDCEQRTITIGDVPNNAPVAEDDAATVTTGSEGNGIFVLTNDSDPDFDGFTITGFQNPSTGGGTVQCAEFSCTYTPPVGFTGTDTFNYTITDQPAAGTPLSDTAKVTVTVLANQPPEASPTSVTVKQDTPKEIFPSFFDPDGDNVTITGATDPAHGTATCSSLSCTYTPDTDYLGPDSFDYTVSDGALTDTATISISVEENQPPDAQDDEYTVLPTTAGRTLSVLDNDFDPESDPLTITAVQNPTTAGGSVTCNATVCTYVPPPGNASGDSFTYTISDGEDTDTATVTIALVDCPNPEPAFGGGLVTGHQWIECPAVEANGVVTTSPTTIMSVDADGGFVMTSGSVANTAGPNDSTGTTAGWGTSVRGARDVSIVRLDLQVPSGAECLAFDFTFGSEEYPEFVGSFNDAFLAELDTSSWSMIGNDITAPHNFALDSEDGVVSVNGTFFDPGRVIEDGGWEYDGSTARLTARTPVTPGAHTLYLSVFDANDSALDSGALLDNLRTGTTACTGGVNQPPVAVDDTATTAEDTAVDIDVLANDTDLDPGDTLSAIVITQPEHGSAALNADGTVRFTPDPDWFGTTTFTYRVTDSAGNSDVGTVTVTVTPVNDAPVTSAGPDRATDEGSPITLAGAVNDVDDETAPLLTWSIVSGPAVTTPPSGTFSSTTVADPQFTPKENGTYVLRLEACDAEPLCTSDTVTVIVTNVAPSVLLPVDRTVDAAVSTEVTVTFTDPGTNDTHTAVVDWGDGSADTTVDPAVSPFAVSHMFTTAGTFTVQGCVTDDDGGVHCDSMEITVVGDNSPPEALDDSAATAEDTAVDIPVLTNDSDPDGDDFSITDFAATSAQGGTVSCTAAPNVGTCTYTPAAGFNGTDSFTYTITDQPAVGAPLSDTATVTVTVGTPCAVDTFVLSNGDPATDEGALAVRVDGAGRFGVARTGSPGADFNPAGPIGGATSTFSSDVYLGTIGVLAPCEGGAETELVSESATEVVTRTEVGDVSIDLTQTVSPLDGTTATLTQEYEITNEGTAALDLNAVRHIDGDLQFDATLVDGGAASADGSVLYEFDQSDDPSNPVTYVGIEGDRDGSATPDRWTIQPYEYLGDIIVGAGIPEGHDGVVNGDTNGDRITDNRYDVTLSQQWDGTIPAGGSTTLQTVTRFGQAVFNNAPVLTPGGPYETAEGSPVTLGVDVVDADHPDGPFTYEWTPATGLSGADTATPTFTPADNGSFDLTVDVCDPGLVCTTATVTVDATNVAPTVQLPADRTVGVGDPTEVTVTFTDPGTADTHIALIDWGDGSADTTVDPAVSGFSRSHTFTAQGTYTVEGCVTDDDGGQHCDSMVVTVVNGPPVAADDSATTAEDAAVAIDVLANDTDPEDDELTVEITSQPADGTAAVNPDGTITYTPPPNFHGTTTFTYTVSDGEGGSDTATVTVTVTPVNDAPAADAGPDRNTPEGTAVTLAGSGTDIDSTELTFVWTPAAGLVPGGNVAQPTFTPADNGTTTYTLGVCDDADPPACDPTPDTMTVTATNVAPDVTAPEDQEGDVVEPITVTVAFTDPGTADTHAATVNWGDGSDPEDIDPVSSPFEIEHTYTDAGSYDVTVCVTDDDGGGDCVTFTVTAFDGGDPVAVDDDAETTEDTPQPIFVLDNDADPDGDDLLITAVSEPAHGTAVISDEPAPEPDVIIYTPALNYFGPDAFTYTISDGHGGTATATVTVDVTPENDEPVVLPGPDVDDGVEGTSVAVTGSAGDVDGPEPLTYHWSILEGPEVSDEPSGTFGDDTSATTTFLPKQDGTYVLQLEACDAAALCDTDQEDDTVEVTVANVAPTVTLPANRTVNVGVSTSVSVAFTDPGLDDEHRGVVDWGDGTTESVVDPATSPFTVTHTFTTAGTRTVEACVTDDDVEACDTMTITVIAPTKLRIADATITEPDSGTTPMTFTITANPVPTAPVTVVAKSANGTATAPGDYTALPSTGVTVSFGAGQATRTVSVPIVGDLVKEPNETFTVTLSAPTGASIEDGTAVGRINNDDACTIVGTAGANTLNGTSGNDVICGLGGNDTINGLGGNDTIRGGDGNDTIRGGDGNDTLRGEGGNDVLDGGAGNDTIDGGTGVDEATWAGAPTGVIVDLTTNKATGWGTDTLAALERARGSAFNDTLRGNGLANTLWGGNGGDALFGRSGNDVLDGGAGNDTLRGESGADTMSGGSGNDTMSGGDGADTMSGGDGNDTMSGDAGSDDMSGGAGRDTMSGGDGNDRVDGGAGVDLVNGNNGNDHVLGGAGNDRSPNGTTAGVHGGRGTNTVDGGAGTDYCSFGPPSETRLRCELP